MKIRDILLDGIISENPSPEEKLHIVGTAQCGASEEWLDKKSTAIKLRCFFLEKWKSGFFRCF